LAKRETAWSTGSWGDLKIGGKSASAVKDELEEELAHWCVAAMDGHYSGPVLIDGVEYDAVVTVKLQRTR
jgi:hypothetical protein